MELDQIVGLSGLVALALVPYVLASQGTMLAGRTGQFIVFQEGLMLASASLGFLGAFTLVFLVFSRIFPTLPLPKAG